jgi:hypothetical protein
VGKRQTWEREVLAAARVYCDQVRLEKTGGGHIKVIMTGPKGERHAIVASTPGEYRGQRNQSKAFRQVANAVGVYR